MVVSNFVEKIGVVKILSVQKIIPVVRNPTDIVQALPLFQLMVFKSQIDVVLEQSSLLFLIHHFRSKVTPKILGQLNNDWYLGTIKLF